MRILLRLCVGSGLVWLLCACPQNGAPDCDTAHTHLVAKVSQSTGQWGCYRPDQVPK